MLKTNESKTVFKIVEIFSLFSQEKEEIGVREVSRILHFSPSNVYRLLSSLKSFGFLEKDERKHYRLGEKIFEIGALYSYHFPVRKIIRPHAEELALKFGVGVHFGIPSKTQPHSAIIIDRILGAQSTAPIHRITLNVPLHSAGVGKAILAFLPSAKRNKIVKELVLTKFTGNTITNKKRLFSELNWIRENGFALDREETHNNLFCIAAPIFQNQTLVGALSLSGSVERFNEETINEIAKVLKEKTMFISRQL